MMTTTVMMMTDGGGGGGDDDDDRHDEGDNDDNRAHGISDLPNSGASKLQLRRKHHNLEVRGMTKGFFLSRFMFMWFLGPARFDVLP